MAEKSKKSKEAHEEREKRQRDKEKKRSNAPPAPSPTQPEKSNYLSNSKKNENGSSEFNTHYPAHNEDESVTEKIHNPLTDGNDTTNDFVSKLQLEVQLMLRLDHPNIVKVYQVIDSEEETLIIMYYPIKQVIYL